MKTVCLVGMSPTSSHLFIHEPMGSDIWGLNQGHALFTSVAMKRFTGWFQVHPWEEMIARQNPELKHLEWLRHAKIPVYMEEVHPEVPTSVRYPYEAITEMLGGTYLTSAPAFMLAMAIYQDYECIRIYGIDMAQKTEYEDQRPCFEFLLGFALSRGIKVWLAPNCPLLKGPLYAKTVYVTTSTLDKRLRTHIDERDKLLAMYNVAVGKVQAVQELLNLALKGEGKTEPGRIELYQDKSGNVHTAEQDHVWATNGVSIRGTEPLDGIQGGPVASANEPVLRNFAPIEDRADQLIEEANARMMQRS